MNKRRSKRRSRRRSRRRSIFGMPPIHLEECPHVNCRFTNINAHIMKYYHVKRNPPLKTCKFDIGPGCRMLDRFLKNTDSQKDLEHLNNWLHFCPNGVYCKYKDNQTHINKFIH